MTGSDGRTRPGCSASRSNGTLDYQCAGAHEKRRTCAHVLPVQSCLRRSRKPADGTLVDPCCAYALTVSSSRAAEGVTRVHKRIRPRPVPTSDIYPQARLVP